METIEYFIFTSGESGNNQRDWGIKFASSKLGSLSHVEKRLRKMLADFSIPPGLAGYWPNQGENGFVVLAAKWEVLLLWLVPYKDSKEQSARKNISVLGFFLDKKLKMFQKYQPHHILYSVVNHNLFPDILFRHEDRNPNLKLAERPDLLEIYLTNKVSRKEPVPCQWPDEDEGFLVIGQEITITKKTNTNKQPLSRPKKKPKRKSILKTGFIFFLILAAIISIKCFLPEKNKPIDNVMDDKVREYSEKGKPVEKSGSKKVIDWLVEIFQIERNIAGLLLLDDEQISSLLNNDEFKIINNKALYPKDLKLNLSSYKKVNNSEDIVDSIALSKKYRAKNWQVGQGDDDEFYMRVNMSSLIENLDIDTAVRMDIDDFGEALSSMIDDGVEITEENKKNLITLESTNSKFIWKITYLKDCNTSDCIQNTSWLYDTKKFCEKQREPADLFDSIKDGRFILKDAKVWDCIKGKLTEDILRDGMARRSLEKNEVDIVIDCLVNEIEGK